jgi:hypothetical protein
MESAQRLDESTAVSLYGATGSSQPFDQRVESAPEQDLGQLRQQAECIKAAFAKAIADLNSGSKLLIGIGAADAVVIISAYAFAFYILIYDPERKMGNPERIMTMTAPLLVYFGYMWGLGCGRYDAVGSMPIHQLNELLDKVSSSEQKSQSEPSKEA